MKTTLLFALYFLFANSSTLNGQSHFPPIQLEHALDSFLDIRAQTAIYIDHTKNEDWKTVKTKIGTTAFSTIADVKDYGKFDRGRYAYWLYFEIHTSADFEEQLVYYRTTNKDSTTLFQLENNTIVSKRQSGLLVNKEDYIYLSSPSDRLAIPLMLKGEKEYQFLVRLVSSPGFSLDIKSVLYQKNYASPELNKQSSITYFANGGFFCILSFMALFTLIQFFQNKDKAFLCYSIYLLTILLFHLRRFFMHHPEWDLFPVFFYKYWYYNIFQIPIYISYLLFVFYLLEVKKKLPEYYPFFKNYLIALVVFFIIDRILHLIDPILAYEFAYWARLIIHVGTFYFLFILFKIKNKLALYTFLGSFILISCAVATQLFSLSGIWMTEMLYLADIPVTIGILMEILFFSLGLGYKSRLLEIEKQTAKKELIKKTNEANYYSELDQLKTDFYTNVTHEFRTPLTVIEGMANELEEHPKRDPKTKIDLIRKNSKNLLALVNQMLDLSKLKSGEVEPELQQDDIIAFIKYLVETHESFASLKNVGLQFYATEETLVMDFDPKKIEQVLTNLISNAVKFTRKHGKILVIAKVLSQDKEPHLQIEIKDNGIGITPEELPFIFDRFRQANPTSNNQGTGIGLALVKELMVIMNGSVWVESELEKGSIFYLNLKIQNKAPLPSDKEKYNPQLILAKPVIEKAALINPNKELPILLIIEDNTDVTYYLQTCLEDQYQILTARNGKLGIEKAFETLPDIIISDVMMPEKDGFEVCEILKEDERSSHIPIILLTAKATSEDKLAGLTHGADAYLIKPFEKAELLIRLKNLMDIRKTLQEKYNGELISSRSNNSTEKIEENKEDSFIEKVEKIIISHLEEEDFYIPQLARELHLSRSQVYRKIKALTGMSSAIYIRHIRLQKAKELLHDKTLNISEIAYKTGFKSSVYFSQVFKETFGKSPSATRK